MAGIQQVDYHKARLTRTGLRYRLNRRAAEIERIIRNNLEEPSGLRCLEVGAAEGLLLSRLNKTFRFKQAVGIELNEELVKANRDSAILVEVGNAEKLPFPADAFDIVIAAAVIEHVDHPEVMMAECHRVLRTGGIVILTAPHRFHDAIARRIGYVKDETHINSFTRKQIVTLLEEQGFETIDSKRFILCPFFTIPLEQSIEAFLRSVRFSWLMVNLLVVGRK